jgi:hypothetical protein
MPKGSKPAGAPAVVGTGELLSWVACDSCEKWRRLSEDSLAQYQDKAFHCTFLPGVDCTTPEEPYNAALTAQEARGGKVVVCPTCKVTVERAHREKKNACLERHYLSVPSCRPLEDTTPQTIATLIIDLSDRLPYKAVMRRVRACMRWSMVTRHPSPPAVCRTRRSVQARRRDCPN